MWYTAIFFPTSVPAVAMETVIPPQFLSLFYFRCSNHPNCKWFTPKTPLHPLSWKPWYISPSYRFCQHKSREAAARVSVTSCVSGPRFGIILSFSASSLSYFWFQKKASWREKIPLDTHFPIALGKIVSWLSSTFNVVSLFSSPAEQERKEGRKIFHVYLHFL